MSKKHNTKHNRSRSNYPSRLQARGASASSVRMPFIDRKGNKHSSAESLTKKGASEDA